MTKKTVTETVKKVIKKELDKQIEDKQAGLSQGLTAADNIFQYALVNNIDQGTAQGQRVGTRVRLKSADIRFNYSIFWDGTHPLTKAIPVREMLILDRQANGATPIASQLFTTTTAGEMYLSPLNVNGMARYKVLMDKTFALQVHGGSSNINQVIYRHHKVNLGKVLSIYNGTGSGISNINTNALYYCVCTDTSSGAATYATYIGKISLIYEDA